MITVNILTTAEDKIKELKVNGHADFSEHGSDIVCSAVSALTQTALLGLVEVVKLDFKYCIEEGLLSFSLPHIKDGAKKLKAHAILDTMILGLRNIETNYSPYIRLIVKKEV
ncbi:MAG: ribosomal-processing cysteine protease Prp [Lutispora sp.]|nr:ribosomal-processing cysteine protease Prp [Lutispora sp.]MDD4833169.1 ribosomal-processing cysteine protease Prp [Lutispora sp.]